MGAYFTDVLGDGAEVRHLGGGGVPVGQLDAGRT